MGCTASSGMRDSRCPKMCAHISDDSDPLGDGEGDDEALICSSDKSESEFD